MRFFDQLLYQYKTYAHMTNRQRLRIDSRNTARSGTGALSTAKMFVETVEREDCKRILFDARQASTFVGLDSVPDNWVSKLRMPFETFYLEFTDPIVVGEYEGDYRDLARGILVSPVSGPIRVAGSLLHTTQMIWFFNGENDGTFTDRGFQITKDTFRSIVSTKVAKEGHANDPSSLVADVGNRFVAGSFEDEPDRHLGWWERSTIQYAHMFQWILTYMMAKGIRVTEERLNRQQRRAQERKKVPTPWHVVEVEPRFSKGGASSPTGITHDHRYDVIGHLRFGRHKLKDGSYREAPEFVPPHQRGLANELYIPSTHSFKRGKVIDPAFQEYMNGGR